MDSRTNQIPASARREWTVLGASGLLLLFLHLVLLRVSRFFEYDAALPESPVLFLVALEVLAGGIYLTAVVVLRRDKTASWKRLTWIGVIGLTMRLCLFASEPILEDDVYRYLWDGAVLVHGVNPYRHAPEEAGTRPGSLGSASQLEELAAESGLVHERINHPHLRTIYPPVAQAAFAMSYLLRPWSINAWRLTLLLFDLAALGLLLLGLKRLRLPCALLAIYWWNPLLIREVYNTNHVDIVAIPFLLGVVLLFTARRHVAASGLLALAAGVKLWPIVLLPFVVQPILRQPRRLLAAGGLFAALMLLQFAPVYLAGLGQDSGFLKYAQVWEMNDAIYMLFLWGGRLVLNPFGFESGTDHLVARIVAALVLLGWILRCMRRVPGGPLGFAEKCVLTTGFLYLLSPTQFPWYYLWMLPFLAVRPRLSFLMWTVLLPLYYLRFLFVAIDRVGLFDNGVVWLQHFPVLWLLVNECRGRRYFGMPEEMDSAASSGR